MAGLTDAAVVSHTFQEASRSAQPIDPGARSSYAVLGYCFRPGDLVVDSVTGQSAKVLYARVANLVTPNR